MATFGQVRGRSSWPLLAVRSYLVCIPGTCAVQLLHKGCMPLEVLMLPVFNNCQPAVWPHPALRGWQLGPCGQSLAAVPHSDKSHLAGLKVCRAGRDKLSAKQARDVQVTTRAPKLTSRGS